MSHSSLNAGGFAEGDRNAEPHLSPLPLRKRCNLQLRSRKAASHLSVVGKLHSLYQKMIKLTAERMQTGDEIHH